MKRWCRVFSQGLVLALVWLSAPVGRLIAQTGPSGNRATVLEQRLQAILAKSGGTWGISVKNLERNEFAQINADQRFQMASVFKIPVLIELYNQVQQGKISLDERVEWRDPAHYFGSGILVNLAAGLRPSIRDLATLMIIVSDNAATDQLCTRLGFDQINSHMHDLGLEHTRVDVGTRDLILGALGLPGEQYRKLTVEDLKKLDRTKLGSDIRESQKRFLEQCLNCGTPSEMTMLLEQLFVGRAANKDSTQEMLQILSNQQFNERLPRWLPYDIRVDHKTGTLLGPVWVVNDAGILYLPGNQHVIVSVFSHGTEIDFTPAQTKVAISGAEDRIAEIGMLVFNYYAR